MSGNIYSSDRDDSMQLLHVLRAWGLSDERREICKELKWSTKMMSDTFLYSPYHSFELVGSTAEGIDTLYFEKSPNKYGLTFDDDMLHLDSSITVLDLVDWDQRQKNNKQTQYSVVAIPDTKFSGYVKLLNASFPEQSYMSSLSFRNFHFSDKLKNYFNSGIKVKSVQQNGPALRQLIDLPHFQNRHMYVENIYCLIYNYWPDEARNWIERPKLSGWPKQNTIDTIVLGRCTLAPVGHADCSYKDIQWRIGIRGEHILFDELNETQICCYVILKLIVKNDTNNVCAGVLSSYIMKNLIFWCSEKFTCDWSPNNLVNCIKLCIEQLMRYLDDGCFPHYFIEKRNLFNSKLTDLSVRINIKKMLNTYRYNVMSVLKLPSFNIVRQETHFNMSLMKTVEDKNVIIECFSLVNDSYSQFLEDPRSIWGDYNSHNTKTCFEFFRNIYRKLVSNKKSFTIFQIRYVKNMLGLLYYSHYKFKGSQLALSMARRFIEQSSYVHCTTILLREATFFFMQKEFDRSLWICNKIIANGIKCRTIEEGQIHINDLETNILEEIRNINDHTIIRKIKTSIVNAFYRKKEEKATNPDPLVVMFTGLFNNFVNDMFYPMNFPAFYMSAEKWAVPKVMLYELLSLPPVHDVSLFVGVALDPIFNSYLLKVLICLDKYDSESVYTIKTVLDDMEIYADEMISKQYFSRGAIIEREIVQTLNIMGYCCLKAHLYRKAVYYLFRSFQKSPTEQNAAYGYIRCISQIFLSISSHFPGKTSM